MDDRGMAFLPIVLMIGALLAGGGFGAIANQKFDLFGVFDPEESNLVEMSDNIIFYTTETESEIRGTINETIKVSESTNRSGVGTEPKEEVQPTVSTPVVQLSEAISPAVKEVADEYERELNGDWRLARDKAEQEADILFKGIKNLTNEIDSVKSLIGDQCITPYDLGINKASTTAAYEADKVNSDDKIAAAKIDANLSYELNLLKQEFEVCKAKYPDVDIFMTDLNYLKDRLQSTIGGIWQTNAFERLKRVRDIAEELKELESLL